MISLLLTILQLLFLKPLDVQTAAFEES